LGRNEEKPVEDCAWPPEGKKPVETKKTREKKKPYTHRSTMGEPTNMTLPGENLHATKFE
jgi:hypothetical protein